MSILESQESKVCYLRREKTTCSILYLVGGLGTGGLERQLYYLLQAMDRERYKPVVVVWNYLENDTYVPWIRSLGTLSNSFLRRFHQLENLLHSVALSKSSGRKSYIPIVFYTNFAAWWAAVGTNAIPLGSFRNDFVTERRIAGRWLGHLSGALPSRHIANSLAAKNIAERFSRPSKIYVVRNGLDINQFSRHRLSTNRPLVLAAGRLAQEKRWDRLLRSVACIAGAGLDFSVCLAGEGPLRKKLEAQVKDLGLETIVQFLGLQQDIPALLKESTFLVHTADAEGCPNIVMEAMACARAVVSTDAGDVPYLVDDGKTGFVIRRGDDKKLTERMMTLIGDRQLCHRMGNAGREKAEREFGLDRLVFETLEAYRAEGLKDA